MTKNLLLKHCLLLVLTLTFTVLGNAAPKFSRGTGIPGVIAWQDDANPNQFWYLPGNVPVILGETLQDFKVTYWGIGKLMLVQEPGSPIHKSRVGAVVSGRANIDITAAQRAALIAELKKTFGVPTPAILPLRLREVKVTPVIDVSTLTLGQNNATVIFPDEIAFGSTFAFTVGTGNSLFAQFAAAQNSDINGNITNTVRPNPNFAVNLIGKAEFVGDPWTAQCTANLSQIWSKVRTQVNASVGWGWFRVGSAQYSSIVQNLIRDGDISCVMQEGSLDNEKYGRQILELGKKVFEEINKLASSGEGFFKFEPNPEPAALDPGKPGGWFGWGVSVNASYSSAHFTQTFNWNDRVTYTGRFYINLPASMVLAVDCNAATASHFIELGMSSQPCVTDTKAAALQARLQAENLAKKDRVNKQLARLENGEITSDQFEAILAAYAKFSITEDLTRVDDTIITSLGTSGAIMPGSRATVLSIGLPEQEIARLEEEAAKSVPRPTAPRRK